VEVLLPLGLVDPRQDIGEALLGVGALVEHEPPVGQQLDGSAIKIKNK
jgi:hypothetical protein